MNTEKLTLPGHWACALFYGDLSGYEDDDLEAIRRFTDDMVRQYGQCFAISCDVDVGFMRYHDAKKYGVLACDCSEYTFDIGAH